VLPPCNRYQRHQTSYNGGGGGGLGAAGGSNGTSSASSSSPSPKSTSSSSSLSGQHDLTSTADQANHSRSLSMPQQQHQQHQQLYKTGAHIHPRLAGGAAGPSASANRPSSGTLLRRSHTNAGEFGASAAARRVRTTGGGQHPRSIQPPPPAYFAPIHQQQNHYLAASATSLHRLQCCESWNDPYLFPLSVARSRTNIASALQPPPPAALVAAPAAVPLRTRDLLFLGVGAPAAASTPMLPIAAQQTNHHRSLGYLGNAPKLSGSSGLNRRASQSCRDLSKPLHVDCSVEYDLGHQPEIPRDSEPLLIIHPAYQRMQHGTPVRQQQRPPPSFQAPPPPPQVTYDPMTGVSFTQSAPPVKRRGAAAVTRHSSFVVAGGGDWRLPSVTARQRLFGGEGRPKSGVTVNGMSVLADEGCVILGPVKPPTSKGNFDASSPVDSNVSSSSSAERRQMSGTERVLCGGGRHNVASTTTANALSRQDPSSFSSSSSSPAPLHLSLPDVSRGQKGGWQSRSEPSRRVIGGRRVISGVGGGARRSLAAKLDASRKLSADSGAHSVATDEDNEEDEGGDDFGFRRRCCDSGIGTPSSLSATATAGGSEEANVAGKRWRRPMQQPQQLSQRFLSIFNVCLPRSP